MLQPSIMTTSPILLIMFKYIQMFEVVSSLDLMKPLRFVALFSRIPSYFLSTSWLRLDWLHFRH